LIYLIRVALNAMLPPGYVAIGNHCVWMDDTAGQEPDVSLFGSENPPAKTGGLATLPDPLSIRDERAPEPWEGPCLEIRAVRGQRLVVAIEVLSISNKTAGSKGCKVYREKQTEFRLGGVNLVEIGHLRSGTYTTAVTAARRHRA
jgi:hypothetical protein